MKPNNLLTLFFSLFLSFSFSFNPLSAQTPLRIDRDAVPGIAEHLVCQYPNAISISKKQIIRFLYKLLDEVSSSNRENYCPAPIPKILYAKQDEIAFQWEAIPSASNYIIGSLGLLNGNSTRDETSENTILLDRSSNEPCLIGFLSDSPDAKDLVIIITDKDLDFTDNNSPITCGCQTSSTPFFPNGPRRCHFGIPVIFTWNNTCPVNKYVFIVSGTIGNQTVSVEYWFLYDQVDPFDIIVHNFPNCNPDIPFHIFTTNDPAATLANAISVTINKEEVQFEQLNNLIDNFNVVGKICGCYESIPNIFNLDGEREQHAFTPQAPIQVMPNPFTTAFEVQINLANRQSVNLQLLDIKGQILLEKNRHLEKGPQQIPISTATLPAGLYHLQLTASGEVFQQKIVKSW